DLPLSRTSRTVWALNSVVNVRRLRLAMTHSYRTFVRSGVSTKPGQVQGIASAAWSDPPGQPTSSRSIEGSGDDGDDGPDPKFRFKTVCFFRRFTSDAVVPGTSKKGRLGTKARDKGL